MHRRSVLAAVAALCSSRAWAEHGWEAYDTTRPLYLEGEVATLLWSDPHAYLELAPDPGARVPADLRQRLVPRQKEQVDTAALLAKAALPTQSSRIWRVELASLARLSVWDVPRPKIKDRIGVIGHAGPPVRETPTLRAEILFIGGKAYPLRSDPA
ncbi:DUF6152 family protein [Caldimonas tepidiphila]|uniref:DUF6152 family protein n=1 Tax=Caldimonas tepidiphila TaxID=2315841 RepID=UPI000E5C2E33|nr:DUF6152 family protein [Caldimonas tepidiphila]